MRLGRVHIGAGYIVDLDNPDMVDEAKECLYEDIMNAVKYDELDSYVDVMEDPTVNEGDIPEFLKHEEEIA
jgi:hypothetical protein